MKKFFLALLVFSVAVGSAFFFSCDSQMGNESAGTGASGTITFTFGTGATARWTGGAPSTAIQGELAHEIKLYRGDNYGTLYKTITVGPGVTSHTETGIPLGPLKVTIDSKLNGYPFAHGETTTTVVANPNRTSAPVNMDRLEHGIVLSEKSGSTYHFPVLSPAYGAGNLTPLTVTVENYAENATGVLSVSSDNTSFAVSPASIADIAQDNHGTFTVTPATSLAVGTHTATISVTGDNGIDAFFTVSVTVGTDFNVTNTADWTTACNIISTGGDGKSYTINVTGDFFAPGVTENTFGSVTGLSVTIAGNRTITISGDYYLLDIGANQTVILKDTNLKALSSKIGALVYINGGTLNMEGGSISGNRYSSNYSVSGGGVVVSGGGTFNMSGGTISGNSASGGSSYSSSGGGVYVAGTGTTFNMTGGTISGNYANNISSGGGVCINTGAIFNMSGGTISGNNTSTEQGSGGGVYNSGTFTMSGTATISGNTARDGCGVYSQGTFNMEGGTITGNLGNSASGGYSGSGGGLYNSSGTFTMTGGTISDNAAGPNGRGGGVYRSGGTIRLATGTIYGSNEAEGIKNTAGNGAALNGNAERGFLTGSVWTKIGDLTTTDDTIKVKNGEFEP